MKAIAEHASFPAAGCAVEFQGLRVAVRPVIHANRTRTADFHVSQVAPQSTVHRRGVASGLDIRREKLARAMAMVARPSSG